LEEKIRGSNAEEVRRVQIVGRMRQLVASSRSSGSVERVMETQKLQVEFKQSNQKFKTLQCDVERQKTVVEDMELQFNVCREALSTIQNNMAKDHIKRNMPGVERAARVMLKTDATDSKLGRKLYDMHNKLNKHTHDATEKAKVDRAHRVGSVTFVDNVEKEFSDLCNQLTSKSKSTSGQAAVSLPLPLPLLPPILRT